jgi:hypothetical protein
LWLYKTFRPLPTVNQSAKWSYMGPSSLLKIWEAYGDAVWSAIWPLHAFGGSAIVSHPLQCIRKVFRLLDIFHILLRYNLILKMYSSIYTQYSIMTKQKHFFRNFCKVKTCHLLSFQTLSQYFVESPLAAITASSLLGYDATSLAHLYLGSYSHSSL